MRSALSMAEIAGSSAPRETQGRSHFDRQFTNFS